MLKVVSSYILKKWGWSSNVTVPFRDKCIICVAPHTSNWDFILGELHYASCGRKAGFLMKKEWFFWPLGPIFRKMGGIPVTRNKKMSLTDQLVAVAKESDYFNLAITPEGTRKLATKWKRGFYYIALGAGIPIQLYVLDGRHKKIICTREIMPSGNVEADMKEIMEYYDNYKDCAIKPHQFSVEVL